MKYFPIAFGSVFTLALVLLGGCRVVAADRPDILFLFSDDQAFETIGALGLTDIETPNLDRLVKGGTTFTHAYNMGSWSPAVCVASRHMLNTGAFLWKAQQISNRIGKGEEDAQLETDWPDFAASGLMWSQLLSASGYQTCFTGKWHVRGNPAQLFDTAQNVRGGMPAQTEEGYNRPTQGVPDPWSPFDPKFGGFWEGGRHWSEVVADDAIEFLGLAEQSEDPFFLYIAFNAPHDPRQSPEDFINRYPPDRMVVPENFLSEYPFKDDIDNPATLRDERLAPYPRTEYAVQIHRQEYYAIITHMDEQIGRVLDRLEQSGRGENTVVIFTSDHGLAVGQHGLIGKQNLYDHSVRVPLILSGPGIDRGVQVDAPVYFQDVMPTVLELAGIPVPEHVQFRSLLPVLDGEPSPHEAVYGAYLMSQRSVVDDGWKLILYPKVPHVLLFDLENDPWEMNNVAESHPEKAKSLFDRLLALQEETGDSLDLRKTFPELSP